MTRNTGGGNQPHCPQQEPSQNSSPERGGRTFHPDTNTMTYRQPHLGQMMPQPPFFNPGNQPVFGGFMNPPLQQYFQGRYTNPPNYSQYGGFMNPPLIIQPPTPGWVNPTPHPPQNTTSRYRDVQPEPQQSSCIETHWWASNTMEVDDSIPLTCQQPHQDCHQCRRRKIPPRVSE